jgi:hypothetical protein
MNSIAKKATAVTPSNTNYITDSVSVVSLEAEQVFTSVNITAETITLVNHGYNTNDVVVVKHNGTTDLSKNTLYFVIRTSADVIQLSLSFNGTAVNIGGANTTAPTLAIITRQQTVRVEGCISVVGAGDVVVLPADHPDTNTATLATNGAVRYTLAAGQFLPIVVKKVFATGTTATGIVCSYGQ